MSSDATWLALGLVLIGGYWVIEAVRIGLWVEGQPASGLMPAIYGALLLVFSGFALGQGRDNQDEASGTRKPIILIGIVILTVLGLEVVGAVVSIGLMMFVVFVLVERFAVLKALAVSVVVTLVLALVFKTWLGVPLPGGMLDL